MSLGGSPSIFSLDPHETSANQQHQWGTVGMDTFGDLYRYIKAGASNISAGKLQLAPAPIVNHHNMTATAALAANTSNKITVTLGATAATANEYSGGLFVANDNSPEGETYRVVSHPAANSAATLEVTIDRLFPTAITTSSQFTLYHNAWNGVVEGTSTTQQPAGVPVTDITAAEYGWIKSRGIVAGLADETLTIGALLTAGTSVAGAFEELDDIVVPLTDRGVAYAVVAGVDTEYLPVELIID